MAMLEDDLAEAEEIEILDDFAEEEIEMLCED